MENSSVSGIKELLRQYDLRPKKGYGQHFLIDRNILSKIVAACEPPIRKVVEIGTGLGALTLQLAQVAQQVITVEIDRALLPLLRDLIADKPSIKLIEADVLSLNWREDLLQADDEEEKAVICGNLPYNITTPIIFETLKHKHRIKHAVFMMQKEVGERLLAGPGGKDYGLLTVMASYHADTSVVAKVSRNCFYPMPEVESIVVKIKPRQQPRAEVLDEDIFSALVRAAFQKRRKTMLNVLSGITGGDKSRAGAILDWLGIDHNRRGETLSIEEFAALANMLSDRK